MEEVEVPLEGVQEDMHHHATHSKEKWISGVALSSALLAVMAAVAAMLSGANANEALMEQVQSSDQWAMYQAKSIKSSLLNAKADLFIANGKEQPEKDKEKLAEYKKEMEEITERAKEKEEGSKHHLETHETLARGVTLFQVAIAIGAISALTKKKAFWFASLVFGVGGAAFLAQGLMMHH